MGRPARPDLHDALLEAARVEFASHGLERARVADVARRAGASKGAFYLHFASKEEAFEEILQRFMGAMEDQARRREEAEACFRQDHATMSEAELRERQVDFDCRVTWRSWKRSGATGRSWWSSRTPGARATSAPSASSGAGCTRS